MKLFWSTIAAVLTFSSGLSARAETLLSPRVPESPSLVFETKPVGSPGAGQVVARFRAGLTVAGQLTMVTAFGCQVKDVNHALGYTLIQVREGRVDDLLSVLTRRPEVLSAEPNGVVRLFDGEPLFDPYQWNLFDRGTPSGSAVSQFGIQAAAAWKHTRGEGVTVAVLDTGVAYEDHDRFYQAPGLATTRFTRGYDVVDHDDHPNDYNGHGTHVTGILADNLVDGAGTVGVAPDVTVMPVRVIGVNEYGTSWDVAEGIRWAADQGAGVINMSLGHEEGSSILADACRYAAARDCVLVAAAGNENAAEVSYPAYYPDCIAVGATGFDGSRAPYSNRGKRLFVMAPGGNLRQDLNRDDQDDGILAQTFEPDRGYDSFSYFYPYQGTSMAAPQVAGVAALIRAANPSLSAVDVRLILRETALHLGQAGRNVYFGYGLVDASAAVDAALAQQQEQEQDPP